MKENEKSEDVLPEADVPLDAPVISEPVDETADEEAPKPKPKSKGKKKVDQWVNADLVPSGATGPTVSKIRVSLGLPSAGRIDRQVSLRVRRLQLGMGLAQTGIIDADTRKALNV